jgi:stearoyl-CoA desaturase (delta-9 desaturase)
VIEFVLLFLLFYLWHGLGITIGYHRLLSHRSFSCPKAVEYFWVLGGYLACQGSPIWWATIHRAHHRYVDTPLDPHAPKHGMFNAYSGWLLRSKYQSHVDPHTQSKDLLKDRLYLFLEQDGDLYRAHAVLFTLAIAFRVFILVTFGWIPTLASLLAGMAVWQIPLMLNVACHIPRLGYKNFATADDSVNVWWVALLAMGEGWHNNHHAFPGSARSGLRWFEFDVSWLLICLMKHAKLLGRVNDMSEPQPVQVISACAHAQSGAEAATPHRSGQRHRRRGAIAEVSANQPLDLAQHKRIFLNDKSM